MLDVFDGIYIQKVENVVGSSCKCKENSEGKIPAVLFTEDHKNLKDAGEKWMKETANSCSVVAALVITIMFAAAITVPGGNDNKTGFPVFGTDKGKAFLVFAIADAVSLFASTTSLLLFLSILTSRFSQNAFLYIHPTKLIFALQSLYVSLESMMVAFTATVFLVLGREETWVLVPMSAVACLAGAAFISLQFRPIVALIFSTSGLGLKRRLHSLTKNFVALVAVRGRNFVTHVGHTGYLRLKSKVSRGPGTP